MSRTRYGLTLASAATLASLSCGALVGAAVADPGGVPHHGGDKGKHLGQIKHGDKPDKPGKPGGKDKGDEANHGHGHAYGHAHAPGQQQDKGPKGQGEPGQGGQGQGEQSDPPGNNGTVKIAAPGDAVGHPSNNPHPGCSVVVEWFGFDAGDDVVSTVSFAPQAPTSDVTIGGTSPSSVFVGGDAASGGTDLDGRQAYSLTFTGDPHPKQGYHVKLTVATPRSLGNDTKTKVFWVEPCAVEESTPQDATGHFLSAPRNPRGPGSPATPAGPSTPDRGVSGPSLSVDEPESDTPVPTAVDAGEDASVVPDWARSPLPLVLVAGGLTLAGVAIARRSQAGA